MADRFNDFSAAPAGIPEHVFILRAADIGANGEPRPAALGVLLQEAASRDAERLGWGEDWMEEHGVFWALLRLSVRMNHLPGWGETIRILTWPRPTERALFHREFLLLPGDGQQPAAAATSTWVRLDRRSRRIRRPEPGEARVTVSEDAVPVLGYDARSVPSRTAAETGTPLLRVRAEYSDLDRNGHVTNTRYLTWCGDALYRHAGHPVTPRGFDINFLSELRYGEELDIAVSDTPDSGVVLAGRVPGADVPAFRARWLPYPDPKDPESPQK